MWPVTCNLLEHPRGPPQSIEKPLFFASWFVCCWTIALSSTPRLRRCTHVLCDDVFCTESSRAALLSLCLLLRPHSPTHSSTCCRGGEDGTALSTLAAPVPNPLAIANTQPVLVSWEIQQGHSRHVRPCRRWGSNIDVNVQRDGGVADTGNLRDGAA